MEFSLSEIREAIRTGVSLVFYPALTIGILIFVAYTVVTQIQQAKDRVRRLTAGLLPLVVLIFALISTNVSGEEIAGAIHTGSLAQFLLGGLLGAAAVFVGRWLRYSSLEIGPTVYVLMLSSLGSLLLFAITFGGFYSLRTYLFGMVIGGAVYVIVAGWFWPRPAKKATPEAVKSYPEAEHDLDKPPEVYPPSI